MTFAFPAVLVLLALPVLLLVWEWRRRGTVLAMPFDYSGAKRGRWLEGIVKIANLGAPLLLAVAIVLLAGPQRPLSQGNQRVLSNIELVLDVSGSMTATFGDGRRSDKAVEALQEFVGHREGDAFGVTLFGTEVLHWVPLTQDLSALKHSAPFMKPEAMPPYMGGTRIGLALRSVHRILANRPEGDRMIVLISDGMSADLRGQGDKIAGDPARRRHRAVLHPRGQRPTAAGGVRDRRPNRGRGVHRRRSGGTADCVRANRHRCARPSSSRRHRSPPTTSARSPSPACRCLACSCSRCSA